MNGLLRGKDLEAVYADLLLGRAKLVGWGCIAPFPYYFLTSPLVPEIMIDADPGKWGKKFCGLPTLCPDVLAEMDTQDTIVMVYPIYSPEAVEQILSRIAQYGPFRAIPPFHAPDHLPLLSSVLEHSRQAPVRDDGRLRIAVERTDRLALVSAQGLADAIRSARQFSRVKGAATPKRARLFIGRLQPGGAERQLTYLARGLAASGWDSAVQTFSPPLPGAESYLMGATGFLHQILPSAREFLSPEETPDGLPPELTPISSVLRLLPLELIHYVAITYWSLIRERPFLVVSYLDVINVAVGIAALLAGVPHILISGRNLNPTHFPNHYASAQAWLKPCYEALLCFPELHLSANSAAGANSYCQWLDLPEDRVSTVPNGLLDGMLPPMDWAARTRLRKKLRIPIEALLIVGVFRLSDEKRPLLFVETAGLLLEEFPQAHVILVGDGPRRADVAAAIRELKEAARFHMVGSRSDATDVLGAADLVLHTAWAEGHPNVLMEAQLLERPIVCTASHGTAECLYTSSVIRVEDTADPALLARSAAAILLDAAEAARAASPARAWLLDRFSIARLVTNSLKAADIPQLDIMEVC